MFVRLGKSSQQFIECDRISSKRSIGMLVAWPTTSKDGVVYPCRVQIKPQILSVVLTRQPVHTVLAGCPLILLVVMPHLHRAFRVVRLRGR